MLVAFLASPSPSPSPTPSPTATAAPTVGDAVSWWGQWITSEAPIAIGAILVFAIALNWVVTVAIRRIVRRASQRPARERRTEDPGGILRERREQRAKAIGQLVRSVLLVVIWATAVLMILPQLGINIAPLIASASVIGVALGFGAQTLVKDYLSGIFLILEDQFGVGDFVDLGEAVGTVEEVTLRVTRLRDTTGIVWYVRNGEILRVANRSQGWTLAIIDIPVGYDEDLDRIQEIIEATAQELVADPDSIVTEFSKPAFAGVESVSGEAVYVRVTAKSDPDEQVTLTRHIRQRLKQAFDQAGIRVPVVFRIPGTVPGAVGGTGAASSAGTGKK